MTHGLWVIVAHVLSWRPMQWPMCRWRPLYGAFIRATIEAGELTAAEWWEMIAQVKAAHPDTYT